MSEMTYQIVEARYVQLPYEAIRITWEHGAIQLIPVDTISLSRLHSNTLRTEQEYEQWDALHATLSAWQGALRRLERSACSSNELRRYLRQKKHPSHAVDEAVHRAISNGIIDDLTYAGRLAEQKLKRQSKGKNRIQMELKQKGLTSNQIREATSFIQEEDEFNIALQWASKRWLSLKGEGREKAIRMARQLQQRGYRSSIIRRVLAELRVNLDNEESESIQ